MNDKNTQKLFEDFPHLFQGRFLPVTENLMGFGFECTDGWFNIIYELSAKLTELINQMPPERRQYCYATQVKEKFGGLRFYMLGSTDEMEDLISEAENLSYKTCEFCGAPGKPNIGGWITTMCEDCRKR